MKVASGKTKMEVMVKLCQHVLDGKGIQDEWKTNVVVLIYKEIRLLEHTLKYVKKSIGKDYKI